ncbi:MAG: aminotransferase class III-fold pyridoxal phosphate-dependent enzyme, partial [Planctomycetia bacterium]|nr:aminotransferase class III-fold pyridoxal phosphate-dependent enzyme [Planctomycetia bacterium]
MNLVEKDLKYIWHPCSQMKDYESLEPIVVDHAAGLYLYDKDGKRYADIVSSWWCNLLGHCHPRISEAIKHQLDRMEHVIFANFTHEPAIELCEKLMEVVPKGLDKFFFNDNGSASIEAAMKMSFQYHYQTGHPEKTRFMSLSDAYHGETLGALSVGGVDLYSKMYKPLLLDTIHLEGPDCYRCPYGKNRNTCNVPCFEKVQEAFRQYADETCAVLVEPLVQGAAGMKIYPAIY